MEFEQAFMGSRDWTFPSPTATPTRSSFGNHLLQTPKTATFPSHFQDAFNTPQMPGYATPQQTQHGSMAPVLRSQVSADALRYNIYHGNLQSGTSSGVLSQGASQLGTTYGCAMPTSPVQATGPSSFETLQMQTPPPTRDASVKKPQEMHIEFGTPSTIASRRFATPQQPATAQPSTLMAQQTLMQFPQISFSPDLYRFANAGPASAPLMPQMPLFWDPTSSPQHVTEQSSLSDPFAPTRQSGLEWPAMSVQPSIGQAISFDTPAMTSFPLQSPHPRPSSAIPLGSNVPSVPGPQLPSTSLVPSLIYSSPIRPMVRSTSRPSKPRSKQTPSTVKRKDSADPSSSRSGTPSPVDNFPAVSGLALRRSNTTGTARPSSVHSSLNGLETLGRRNSVSQISRTSSPLKRAGKTPLGSISEHTSRTRASVILTIDENGRARTERRNVADDPTKSIREKYPGLYDSDSSEEESDATEHGMASFTFAKGEERRSKAVKLDPPVEGLDGLSIPRSSSSASLRGAVTPSRAAIAAVAQLRKQGSLRKKNRISPAKHSTAASVLDTCPMDVDHEQARDIASLQPLQFPTQAPVGGWTGVSHDFSSLGLGQATTHHWRTAHTTSNHQHYRPPLTAIPSQQQPPPRPALLIRCICGVKELQDNMIRCSSCTQWLHGACVGLEAQRSSQPRDYTCFLCTKPANMVSVG